MKQLDSSGEDSMRSDSIREMVFGFQKSRILLTAFELGLFTALGENTKSSGQVAAEIGTDSRATDRLMNALVTMHLLQKEDGGFSNTSQAKRYLVKDSSEYLAGLMHAVNLWDTWSTLSEAVRQGTSVAARHFSQRRNNWLESFIAAMHERASRQAATAISLLDLSGVSRVLDVGGGSGAFSMAFVQAKEGVKAVVFDLPEVATLTKKYVKQAGLLQKVDMVAGDYLTNDLGNGFDLVFLSAIIHSNSPDENQMLLRKCAKALVPYGQVVVQDFIMDDDRTSPAQGAIFALNMLVGTGSGDTYTETEVRSWMQKAGFSDIKRNDTPFGSSQIVGRKQ